MLLLDEDIGHKCSATQVDSQLLKWTVDQGQDSKDLIADTTMVSDKTQGRHAGFVEVHIADPVRCLDPRRHLCILSWNCGGLTTQLAGVRRILLLKQPSVLLLQEAGSARGVYAALRAQCASMGYTIATDPDNQLVAIYRHDFAAIEHLMQGLQHETVTAQNNSLIGLFRWNPVDHWFQLFGGFLRWLRR